MPRKTLATEIAEMSNEKLLEELTCATRKAWFDFCSAKTRKEQKKAIYGKKYHREKRLAAEVLRRMNTAS